MTGATKGARACPHVGIQGEGRAASGYRGRFWGTDKDYFLLRLDQVGSFRALINGAGGIVKRVDYDSFGNVLFDSLPELYIPLGFGGGICGQGYGPGAVRLPAL